MIVGPNASGKTSILEGLYYLARLASVTLHEFLKSQRDFESLRSRGVTDEEVRLECSSGSEALRLKVFPPQKTSTDVLQHDLSAMSSEPDTRWRPDVEYGQCEGGVFHWRHPFGTLERDPIASVFRSVKLLRLDARILAEPSYGDREGTGEESNGNGQGLASALALMALNQPDRFLSLQERLRSVIPAVRRIRFNRVPVSRIETETVKIDNDSLTRRLKKEYIGEEIVFDFQGAADIPAHLASEGTVLVLGLLAVLLGPDRPKLVLLDDLDHGLHPKAQRNLVQLLRKIMEEDHELQIIATAHSPYIANELEPEEVRVTSAGEDGATRCARLDSHPDFERWKDEMWPGEFWSVVGEQWVGDAQGRESP